MNVSMGEPTENKLFKKGKQYDVWRKKIQAQQRIIIKLEETRKQN